VTVLAVRTVGEWALLFDVRPADRHAVAARLRSAGLFGVTGVDDVVPGETSVLVRFTPGSPIDVERLRELAETDATTAGIHDDVQVLVPVRYDGPDLDDVATRTGLSPDEVVSRHLAGDYVVAFMGFAPGFAYLDGLPAALQVPRLATPRTRVDPGSVAIAGSRCCIYPRATPGGWRVIGRTDAALFDVTATPPTPLAAGRRVRFVEAGA
jgi:KipI family sensor histidine kinase inhibitor